MSPGWTSAWHDDLVGGRGAVGDEVGLPGAERLGRQVLRLAQRPGRLQQRVEAAAGRGGLGQEDVQAVEVDHVLDPVRVDDRLALRDRQRVEHPGGPVAVLACSALKNGASYRAATPSSRLRCSSRVPSRAVEDPPEVVAEPAGHVLHGDLGHQVQVEFRPDPGQRLAEDLSAVIRRMLHQVVGLRRPDELLRARTSRGRDRWANRRRTTHACSLKLSRAAITASSKLGTTTIS